MQMITCVTRKATSMKKQKSKKSRHESPFSGIVPVFLRMHQFQKFILRHFNTKQCLHHLKKYIMGFFLSVQTDHDDRQFIILFPLVALLFVSPYAVFTIAYFSPVCTYLQDCYQLLSQDAAYQKGSFRFTNFYSLKVYHCETLVASARGSLWICPEEVSCDYFDWCEGKLSAINQYHGEYMAQYKWAEFTNGELNWGRGR